MARKLTPFAVGTGAWLIAGAISIWGGPWWLGLVFFVLGVGLMLTAGLWWIIETGPREKPAPRPGHVVTRGRPQPELTVTSPRHSPLAVSLARGIAEDAKLGVLPLATELRDIRRKIEKLKSMAVRIYWDGFQLPAARWDEYHKALAGRPTLYRAVESAYVAANDVNEAVNHRRTVAGKSQIGVAPSDPLDAAYEAAGKALDALGQPRGEPWKTETRKAADRIIEDARKELDDPS